MLCVLISEWVIKHGILFATTQSIRNGTEQSIVNHQRNVLCSGNNNHFFFTFKFISNFASELDGELFRYPLFPLSLSRSRESPLHWNNAHFNFDLKYIYKWMKAVEPNYNNESEMIMFNFHNLHRGKHKKKMNCILNCALKCDSHWAGKVVGIEID